MSNFIFDKTPFSTEDQIYGADRLPITSSAIRKSAIKSGWEFTAYQSIKRLSQFSKIRRELEGRQQDAAQRIIRKPRLVGKEVVSDIPSLESKLINEYQGEGFEDDEIIELTPEEANREYGIDGRLYWEKPVSNLEAFVLNRIKQEEIHREWVMSRAKGKQKALAVSVELATIMFDPLFIPALALTPLQLSRLSGANHIRKLLLAKRGKVTPLKKKTKVTRKGIEHTPFSERFVQGAIPAMQLNALAEYPILQSAERRQVPYTSFDSMLNIMLGGFVGGGIYAGLGAASDFLRGLSMKARKAAEDVAVKQVLANQEVNVGPIVRGVDKSPDIPGTRPTGRVITSADKTRLFERNIKVARGDKYKRFSVKHYRQALEAVDKGEAPSTDVDDLIKTFSVKERVSAYYNVSDPNNVGLKNVNDFESALSLVGSTVIQDNYIPLSLKPRQILKQKTPDASIETPQVVVQVSLGKGINALPLKKGLVHKGNTVTALLPRNTKLTITEATTSYGRVMLKADVLTPETPLRAPMTNKQAVDEAQRYQALHQPDKTKRPTGAVDEGQKLNAKLEKSMTAEKSILAKESGEKLSFIRKMFKRSQKEALEDEPTPKLEIVDETDDVINFRLASDEDVTEPLEEASKLRKALDTTEKCL